MTRNEIIDGLKFTIEMFLLDINTGKTFTEPRNDMDKITIDACKGAIELLEQESTATLPIKDKCAFCPHCTNCDVNDDLSIKQTENVVERKKGMWNIIQGNIVVCSVCGMNAPQSMTGCLINRHLEPNKSNFCPNCGADMRKEVE